MKPEKYDEMLDFQETFDDLPDGAFFALAEEQGIEQEDWIELADYEGQDGD